MNKYERVKFYYDNNLWTINQVRNAVVKNWISTEKFFLITNINYND